MTTYPDPAGDPQPEPLEPDPATEPAEPLEPDPATEPDPADPDTGSEDGDD